MYTSKIYIYKYERNWWYFELNMDFQMMSCGVVDHGVVAVTMIFFLNRFSRYIFVLYCISMQTSRSGHYNGIFERMVLVPWCCTRSIWWFQRHICANYFYFWLKMTLLIYSTSAYCFVIEKFLLLCFASTDHIKYLNTKGRFQK